MKSSVISLLIIFIVYLIGDLFAQQFSDDIIVQGPQPNEWLKSSPVIDIDSQGNIGIVWANNYADHYTINFVRSTDGGNTFDSIRVVEDIPYNSGWGGWYTPAVVYDDFDNPLVFYYSYLAPFTDHFRLKKSLDGGNSFPAQYQYFNQSGGYVFGFMLSGSGVGYLGLKEGRKIIVRKTYDHGMTFYDSTIINSGNFGIMSNIKIVHCGNGDILCFWTGQDQTTHRNTIFYNRSTDDGISFSEKVELDSTTQSPHGVNALSYNNEVIITYNGRSDSTNYQLLYKKSEDYGITYSNVFVLHNYTTSPNTSSGQCMKFNPNVGFCVSWNQTNHDRRLLFTRSVDFGNNFDSTITVVEGDRRNERESMAVSDSGDIYVVSTEVVDYYNYFIILNKIRIPLITGIKDKKNKPVRQLSLYQNYPNPFNPVTTIKYQLPKASKVKLEVFNILGQKVKTLVDKQEAAAYYELQWDGKNDWGAQSASGVYFYRLIAETVDGSKHFVKNRKMLLLR